MLTSSNKLTNLDSLRKFHEEEYKIWLVVDLIGSTFTLLGVNITCESYKQCCALLNLEI